jgi:hypothetical protein
MHMEDKLKSNEQSDRERRADAVKPKAITPEASGAKELKVPTFLPTGGGSWRFWYKYLV